VLQRGLERNILTLSDLLSQYATIQRSLTANDDCRDWSASGTRREGGMTLRFGPSASGDRQRAPSSALFSRSRPQPQGKTGVQWSPVHRGPSAWAERPAGSGTKAWTTSTRVPTPSTPGDRRLERSRSTVGDQDLLADDRCAVFLPAAGRQRHSPATHGREGQIGDDLRNISHSDHGTC
jgi:hypothetical protein